MKIELPDFLKLSDEQVTAEKKRQDRLRRDFNSRVRLSPAEMEMARALVLESDLKTSFENTEDSEAKNHTGNQLGEVLAAQGRFIEAVEYTSDVDQKQLYESAANAIFEGNECNCEALISPINGQTALRLPKYRIIKEIYNIKISQFGYLVECNTCGNRVFMTNNPLRTVSEPKSDIELLKA